MVKNCLTFSIKYKYCKSKIKISRPPILEIFQMPFNIKSNLKYFKYYRKENGNLISLFYPHFFIEHNGYYLNPDNGKIVRTKIMTIEEKMLRDEFVEDYISEINVDMFDRLY